MKIIAMAVAAILGFRILWWFEDPFLKRRVL